LLCIQQDRQPQANLFSKTEVATDEKEIETIKEYSKTKSLSR
jgi:hypothetical protein